MNNKEGSAFVLCPLSFVKKKGITCAIPFLRSGRDSNPRPRA